MSCAAANRAPLTACWRLGWVSGRWNCCSKGNPGLMVGLQGREIGTVTLEDATTKQREVSEEYVAMAEVLSR